MYDFVALAIAVHGKRFTYDKTVYVNSKTKVVVTCEHGDHNVRPDQHLTGALPCGDCRAEVRNRRLGEKYAGKIKELATRYPLYDFSGAVAQSQKCKLRVVCSTHGVFHATYRRFSGGDVCPACVSEHKSAAFVRELEARDQQGRYDYSETNYVDCTKKITVRCREHNVFFQQAPFDHRAGKTACPECVTELLKANQDKHRITAPDFIRRAQSIHGDRYDYSEMVYAGFSEPLKRVRCIKHDIFFDLYRANRHIHRKSGCPECTRENVSESMSMSVDDFLTRAKEAHGDFYEYDLPQFFRGTTKIRIKCPKHGWFKQPPTYHAAGRGCRGCSDDAAAERKTMGFDEVIERSRAVHGDLYDYSQARDTYRNAQECMTIICREHGLFQQRAVVHYRGGGCIKCAAAKRSASMTKDIDQFISDARGVHGDTYDYSNVVYEGAHTKVEIVCKLHGPFYQCPNSHLNAASGCPSCGHTISKKEHKWLDLLGVTVRQHPIKLDCFKRRIRVDGYDEKSNTVFLFHGDFWHGNPKVYPPDAVNKVNKRTFGFLYEQTLAYESALRAAGYNLEVMWESDFDVSMGLSARDRH